ncbi:cupin domain-containing protein [Apiospora arundinis]|uniref:Cupin domain-containing protein n=1 Tax=Apiospora arundinis TaxID=335852 RepID=A0ABR2IHH8_9PEZI
MSRSASSLTSRLTLRPRLIPVVSSHSASHYFSRINSLRAFSTTKMASFSTPSSDRPKNEMQYFPDMLTALPSKSSEFRRVLWTGLYSQLVLMTVPVGGDIGDEVHSVDQILTFTSGTGLAQIAGKEQEVKGGDLVIVPAGTQHQFINTGPTPLLLYTVYSPAEHKPTTVHKTKEEGDQEEEDGIDVAPEWSQRSKAQNEKEGWVKVPEE